MNKIDITLIGITFVFLIITCISAYFSRKNKDTENNESESSSLQTFITVTLLPEFIAYFKDYMETRNKIENSESEEESYVTVLNYLVGKMNHVVEISSLSESIKNVLTEDNIYALVEPLFEEMWNKTLKNEELETQVAQLKRVVGSNLTNTLEDVQ